MCYCNLGLNIKEKKKKQIIIKTVEYINVITKTPSFCSEFSGKISLIVYMRFSECETKGTDQS